MRRALIILLLITLIGVVALEAIMIVNMYKMEQNLNYVNVTLNTD